MSLNNWTALFRQRFFGRTELPWDDLYDKHFSNLPRREVFEMFEFLGEEFGLPIGILRPDDPLEAIFEPVPTRNPVKWLSYRGYEGDMAAELHHRLAVREKTMGTAGNRAQITTFGEYAAAWCGM